MISVVSSGEENKENFSNWESLLIEITSPNNLFLLLMQINQPTNSSLYRLEVKAL